MGVEYWRDYLKLSATVICALVTGVVHRNWTMTISTSGERLGSSRRRLVTGLAELGGKLVYEQYYGDEVALFGKTSDKMILTRLPQV